MTRFSHPDDLRGAAFVDLSLRGARFTRAYLSGVLMRAVDVTDMDTDAPWLLDGESVLRVNGSMSHRSSSPSSTGVSPAGMSGVRRTRPGCARRGPR
ncbi:hypothetical protein [Lentzea flaviverrucosa]|uniref:Pentapeptide repeat-containing protein n=1 Tax=Lentzea flaviverrucosa TaxID=200379 RepID=A0A1H9WUN8_9PSEU|nr:hypothetical protein [Lentzea flaviverrucosa]RDI23124.1 hypothetical protein DFR72_111255 [Lentzea flaviverrucosa]SES37650.1 hypothetical protein SAMN05216195_112249 [Lentzea flaviverrucosa]